MLNEFISNKNLTILILTIFLLIVVQCGGYISELLTCKLQKLLTIDMASKHIVLFFVIFSVLMISDNKFEKLPNLHLLNSSLIYLSFLLFIKMNLKFTLLSIFILTVILILNHTIEYYKNKKNSKNKQLIQNLEKIKNISMMCLIIIIIMGFVIYFNEKRIEYKNNWSTYKFIFGVNKCKSLK